MSEFKIPTQTEIDACITRLAEELRVKVGTILSGVAELPAKQELAWTPLTSVEQVEGLEPGFYAFSDEDDLKYICCIIGSEDRHRFHVLDSEGRYIHTAAPRYVTGYKLIHAFDEPEKVKSYKHGLSNYDLNRIAEDPGFGGMHDMAKDLLALQQNHAVLQQRVRELEKGEA